MVRVFGRTDIGRAREHNEDALLIADLSTGGELPQGDTLGRVVGEAGMVFMVADGLGGAAAGEIASQMAVTTVLRELLGRTPHPGRAEPQSFAAALKAATESANARIYAQAVGQPEHRGMGTTATVAGLLADTIYIVQVGDSRAYLVRNGRAEQITKDQSLMQRLIEAGELTVEEAEHSDRRNIILQALGPEPLVRIDLTYQQVRRGDVLVLCTDGLSGVVRPAEIAAIVTEELDLKLACQRLIDLANAHGGPDNITVIVARFEGPGLGDASETDHVGRAEVPLPEVRPRQAAPPDSAGTAAAPQSEAGPAEPSALLSPRAPRSRRGLVLAITALILLVAVLLAACSLRGGQRTEHAARHRVSTPVQSAG